MYGLRGYRGLGFTMWDLMDQAGHEDCGIPPDSACEGRNQQRDIAVQDLWYSTYQKDPNTANLPVPNISVAIDTSAAATQRFLNNQPLTSEQIEVGAGPYQSVAQLENTPFYTSYVPPAPPKITTPPAKPVAPVVGTSSGSAAATGGASTGTPGAPDLTSSLTLPNFSQGFNFSDLPWYVWAGGAAVAFFALRGKG